MSGLPPGIADVDDPADGRYSVLELVERTPRHVLEVAESIAYLERAAQWRLVDLARTDDRTTAVSLILRAHALLAELGGRGYTLTLTPKDP